MAGGVAVHVRQRGVDGQACFREDVDRLVYLSTLRDLSRGMQCAVHAYCLMTNHVHLLITPPDANACAVLMRDLGRRYVPYFNRRHGRTGTLWEGRFRSCIVDSREYVLACHRYIEMNPVRAGIVRSPSAYRWSSHAGNAGTSKDGLLSPHVEYIALGATEAARFAVYREYFAEGEAPLFLSAVRDATNAGLPLAGEAMKAGLAASGVRIERGKPGPRVERAGSVPVSLDLDV